jgi:hypothetical protein
MSVTVTLKLGNNLALTRKMPLAIADMALDVGEVVAKRRPVHAQ